MSGEDSPHLDRTAELLADKAAQGLSPTEASELSRLLGVDEYSSESLELAAAALDLAMNPGPYEPMPAMLRAAVERDAANAVTASLRAPDVVARVGPAPRSSSGAMIAWLAAAACLAVAVTAWWPRVGSSTPDAGQAYERLVNEAPDLTRWDWKAIGELENTTITGEVVWSTDRQEGYMVFSGLPSNAPTRKQYQLWIFDPSQSEATPIDGGVFDITPTADERVIVPIDPKLSPTGPTLFAVTIEKPGGVVVSDRSRIVAIAAPAAS